MNFDKKQQHTRFQNGGGGGGSGSSDFVDIIASVIEDDEDAGNLKAAHNSLSPSLSLVSTEQAGATTLTMNTSQVHDGGRSFENPLAAAEVEEEVAAAAISNGHAAVIAASTLSSPPTAATLDHIEVSLADDDDARLPW